MKHRNLSIAAGVAALAGLLVVPVFATAPVSAAATSMTSSALGSSGAVMIPVSYPTTQHVAYRNHVVYRRAAASHTYIHRRSKKHSAEIIGGSALGGAGLGALVGGKSGALIGGLVGGAAGTAYDRSTHKKVVRH